MQAQEHYRQAQSPACGETTERVSLVWETVHGRAQLFEFHLLVFKEQWICESYSWK